MACVLGVSPGPWFSIHGMRGMLLWKSQTARTEIAQKSSFSSRGGRGLTGLGCGRACSEAWGPAPCPLPCASASQHGPSWIGLCCQLSPGQTPTCSLPVHPALLGHYQKTVSGPLLLTQGSYPTSQNLASQASRWRPTQGTVLLQTSLRTYFHVKIEWCFYFTMYTKYKIIILYTWN